MAADSTFRDVLVKDFTVTGSQNCLKPGSRILEYQKETHFLDLIPMSVIRRRDVLPKSVRPKDLT